MDREEALPGIPRRYQGPGLVDLQLNGYAGHDFNGGAASLHAELFLEVGRALRRRGVVAALPTFITDDADRMVARAQAFRAALSDRPALEETFPGLHVEGPFISEEDGPRGAHPKAYCRSPRDLPDLFYRLWEASGNRILLLTLAPELPGTLELIAEASACGCRVAIGHTQASGERLSEAVDAGAVLSTHLGNGSHQHLPRLDNYVQAQLADDRLFASFIADGHHIPFYTLKNFLRAKRPDRSILITDAMAAADAGPGRYELGGEAVVVSSDGRVHKPGQKNLAGSALTLDRAVLNAALHCDVPFETAWEMASTRAAALIGRPVPAPVAVSVSEGGFQVEGVSSA